MALTSWSPSIITTFQTVITQQTRKETSEGLRRLLMFPCSRFFCFLGGSFCAFWVVCLFFMASSCISGQIYTCGYLTLIPSQPYMPCASFASEFTLPIAMKVFNKTNGISVVSSQHISTELVQNQFPISKETSVLLWGIFLKCWIRLMTLNTI